jgi:hypothetical protein
VGALRGRPYGRVFRRARGHDQRRLPEQQRGEQVPPVVEDRLQLASDQDAVDNGTERSERQLAHDAVLDDGAAIRLAETMRVLPPAVAPDSCTSRNTCGGSYTLIRERHRTGIPSTRMR